MVIVLWASLCRVVAEREPCVEVDDLKNVVMLGWAFRAAIVAACLGVGSSGDLGDLVCGYINAVSCVRMSMIPHAKMCCICLKVLAMAIEGGVRGVTSCLANRVLI